MDALYTKRHESVQHVYHYVLDGWDIHRCNTTAEEALRSVRIHLQGEQGGDDDKDVRAAYKVKVYGVSICFLDPDDRRSRR